MRVYPIELWDGRQEICCGFRDGLPWWKWGWVPGGLVTRTQLREQRLRLSRGQHAFGLLVFNRVGCGEQVAELFRIDLAAEARTMTPAVRASIEAMRRAHCTCRECGREFGHYLSTKTWRCWACMTLSGDFGEPDHERAARGSGEERTRAPEWVVQELVESTRRSA